MCFLRLLEVLFFVLVFVSYRRPGRERCARAISKRNTSLSELEQYPIDLDHLLISPSRSRTDTLSSLDGMLAAVFLSLEHAVYLLKKACLG